MSTGCRPGKKNMEIPRPRFLHLAALFLLMQSNAATAAEIVVLSSGGVRQPLQELFLQVRTRKRAHNCSSLRIWPES